MENNNIMENNNKKKKIKSKSNLEEPKGKIIKKFKIKKININNGVVETKQTETIEEYTSYDNYIEKLDIIEITRNENKEEYYLGTVFKDKDKHKQAIYNMKDRSLKGYVIIKDKNKLDFHTCK